MLDSEKGKWKKSEGRAHFWLQFDPPAWMTEQSTMTFSSFILRITPLHSNPASLPLFAEDQ